MIDAKTLKSASIPEVGEYVYRHGRPLTFDDVAQRIGQFVIVDESTQSKRLFRRVLLEHFSATRRYTGRKQDESYLDEVVVYRYGIKKNERGYVRRYEGIGKGLFCEGRFYDEEH